MLSLKTYHTRNSGQDYRSLLNGFESFKGSPMLARASVRLSRPRIHTYPASFGEDFARALIYRYSKETGVVLDPFVGAGTTALESVLSNRNAIGVDIDPLACKISRVLTSRIDTQSLIGETNQLEQELGMYEACLASSPASYQNLVPGSLFEIMEATFQVPNEQAIAYWFDPSHMATLAVVSTLIAREKDLLVREIFEVALSSSIIRKWPNTLSYAMDIDHSRPHKPRGVEPHSIQKQFALFRRILTHVSAPSSTFKGSFLLSKRMRRFLRVMPPPNYPL